LQEEILEATNQVYMSGRVLDGQNTYEFENAIAKRTNRTYGVAVNSCTTALLFSIMSIAQTQGRMIRNILIPAQSFVATLNSVLFNSYLPIVNDVDSISGLMDLSKMPDILQQVDIIMYVNLFGNVLDYEQMKTRTDFFSAKPIPIIEDAAQSFGAMYDKYPSGSLGTVSCLSFDPTKNLPCYGSGGMVLTNDPHIAQNVLNLRDNGKHSHNSKIGINSKMSEADCAQMLVKLNHFDKWQARRTAIADYYTKELNGVVYPIPVNENVTHAWSKYVVHHHARDVLKLRLNMRGVETRIHYEKSLNQYVTYGSVMDGEDRFSQTCLSLPIFPEMTDLEVETVVQEIKFCVANT